MLNTALAVDLLIQPAALALFALAALLVPRRAGRIVAILLLTLLTILAVPAVSQAMLAALDVRDSVAGPPPDAIVILSADVERTTTPGKLEPGLLTLDRERAGAALYRKTGLPILVSGGLVNGPPPVGQLMLHSLTEDFGVPVRWAELRSTTTWENARLSAPILRDAGVRRVYLVTHGWHMRRSLLAFRRAGIDAIAAPVRDDPWPRMQLQDLIPRVSSWSRAYLAIHEWVGNLAYAVRS